MLSLSLILTLISIVSLSHINAQFFPNPFATITGFVGFGPDSCTTPYLIDGKRPIADECYLGPITQCYVSLECSCNNNVKAFTLHSYDNNPFAPMCDRQTFRKSTVIIADGICREFENTDCQDRKILNPNEFFPGSGVLHVRISEQVWDRTCDPALCTIDTNDVVPSPYAQMPETSSTTATATALDQLPSIKISWYDLANKLCDKNNGYIETSPILQDTCFSDGANGCYLSMSCDCDNPNGPRVKMQYFKDNECKGDVQDMVSINPFDKCQVIAMQCNEFILARNVKVSSQEFKEKCNCGDGDDGINMYVQNDQDNEDDDGMYNQDSQDSQDSKDNSVSQDSYLLRHHGRNIVTQKDQKLVINIFQQ